jgi:prepilin-type N-terminal cleavage/methylation domain-containing protein
MTLGAKDRGFTLLEVMVATAVLSLGVVLIYETFFSSLSAFNYYYNYLNIAPYMAEEMWQAQDKLTHFGETANVNTEGEFKIVNKDCKWGLVYNLIDEGRDLYKLYKIDMSVSWQEHKKEVTLSRSTYALYQKE